MPISNKIRSIIVNHGSTDDIEKTAVEEGMSTLRMSCARLVKEGVTSIAEMRRIVYSNEDEVE